MKQLTFVVECVVSDNDTTLIVREAQTGRIVKLAKDASEIASFLSEIITTIKNSSNSNGNEK